VRVDQGSQRRRAQQRHVPRQQDDRAGTPGQVRFRLEERVPGAELELLQCKRKAQPFRQRIFHSLGLMSDDDDGGRRRERVGRA
jgi:hypothetical protein